VIRPATELVLWVSWSCRHLSMHVRILIRMPGTSVRVDRETHEELKKLARDLGTTVGEAVAIGTRRLRQQHIGRDLSAPLTEDETSWLDADLG